MGIKKETEKPFDCKTCNEAIIQNKKHYCKLRIKDIPTDLALCKNIKSCDWYRKLVSSL